MGNANPEALIAIGVKIYQVGSTGHVVPGYEWWKSCAAFSKRSDLL